MMILCSNPRAQYVAHRAEIDAAVTSVLECGRYILGEQVASFEHAFADYVGVKHAVGVGNGTDALHLALRVLGIGPGAEVITVSHTAVATVAAIEMAGAAPVLVDVEPNFYTLDPSRLAAVLTPRTRAIIPVHLFGQPADMEPLLGFAREHGLKVVEDCAQAHGASYKGRQVGSLGDAGCFSFYPTKNLGAIGDGGIVVTNDNALAERLRELREYGWNDSRDSRVPGWNSRLDELQAAILNVKLRYLDADNEERTAVARRYDEGLAGLPVTPPRRRAGCGHAFHQYVIACGDRDALRDHLRKQGIVAGIHYPVPVHRQMAYADRLAGVDSLPATEGAARRILSLPIYPELEEAVVEKVVGVVQVFYRG